MPCCGCWKNSTKSSFLLTTASSCCLPLPGLHYWYYPLGKVSSLFDSRILSNLLVILNYIYRMPTPPSHCQLMASPPTTLPPYVAPHFPSPSKYIFHPSHPHPLLPIPLCFSAPLILQLASPPPWFPNAFPPSHPHTFLISQSLFLFPVLSLPAPDYFPCKYVCNDNIINNFLKCIIIF